MEGGGRDIVGKEILELNSEQQVEGEGMHTTNETLESGKGKIKRR